MDTFDAIQVVLFAPWTYYTFGSIFGLASKKTGDGWGTIWSMSLVVELIMNREYSSIPWASGLAAVYAYSWYRHKDDDDDEHKRNRDKLKSSIKVRLRKFSPGFVPAPLANPA